jgi:fructose-specific phosphotransferase system IIC component
MPTNPFKPPDTDSTRNPRPPATPGSPLRAVLAGLAVDVGGSVVIGIAISVMYATQLLGQGVAESDLRQAMENMPHASALYIGGTLLGLLMSLLGGYVCARIARRDEYRAGTIMAALSTLLGLMMTAHPAFDEMTVLLTASSIACNLLGVKYGAEYNRRAQAPTDPGKDSSTP